MNKSQASGTAPHLDTQLCGRRAPEVEKQPKKQSELMIYEWRAHFVGKSSCFPSSITCFPWIFFPPAFPQFAAGLCSRAAAAHWSHVRNASTHLSLPGIKSVEFQLFSNELHINIQQNMWGNRSCNVPVLVGLVEEVELSTSALPPRDEGVSSPLH